MSAKAWLALAKLILPPSGRHCLSVLLLAFEEARAATAEAPGTELPMSVMPWRTAALAS